PTATNSSTPDSPPPRPGNSSPASPPTNTTTSRSKTTSRAAPMREPDDPITQLAAAAAHLHELYSALAHAGFTEQQALYLVGQLVISAAARETTYPSNNRIAGPAGPAHPREVTGGGHQAHLARRTPPPRQVGPIHPPRRRRHTLSAHPPAGHAHPSRRLPHGRQRHPPSRRPRRHHPPPRTRHAQH